MPEEYEEGYEEVEDISGFLMFNFILTLIILGIIIWFIFISGVPKANLAKKALFAENSSYALIAETSNDIANFNDLYKKIKDELIYGDNNIVSDLKKQFVLRGDFEEKINDINRNIANNYTYLKNLILNLDNKLSNYNKEFLDFKNLVNLGKVIINQTVDKDKDVIIIVDENKKYRIYVRPNSIYYCYEDNCLKFSYDSDNDVFYLDLDRDLEIQNKNLKVNNKLVSKELDISNKATINELYVNKINYSNKEVVKSNSGLSLTIICVEEKENVGTSGVEVCDDITINEDKDFIFITPKSSSDTHCWYDIVNNKVKVYCNTTASKVNIMVIRKE